MLTIISSSVRKNILRRNNNLYNIKKNNVKIINNHRFNISRTMATLKMWREYIKENPYAYERGGEGYKKIEEIVNNLSHSELQVFVNLSGAAKEEWIFAKPFVKISQEEENPLTSLFDPKDPKSSVSLSCWM